MEAGGFNENNSGAWMHFRVRVAPEGVAPNLPDKDILAVLNNHSCLNLLPLPLPLRA